MRLIMVDGSVTECKQMSKLFAMDKSKTTKVTKGNGIRTRKCRYEKCREPFQPNRSNQYYCCKEHRDAQNTLNYRKRKKVR
jgi:hypothetical protein